MSLAQLEYFVAIAEEGTIGRAARRLHISQPPLSRQLQSLEAELGGPLFQRTRRGVRLLPRGQRLLEHARRILSAVDDAVVDVSTGGAPSVRQRAGTAPRQAPSEQLLAGARRG